MTHLPVPEEKAELHLKLGRKLALFVKTDTFFNVQTFDWICLEKTDVDYKATLFRSVHEGDELMNDVLTFRTLNEEEEGYDEVTNPFFSGSLEDCFEWIQSIFPVEALSFLHHENLKSLYSELILQGVFEKENQ